ncbi:MAG: NIPSNAP family protein [Acidimicrobiia bacterium]|nr:NIPSNAP family protein [Acidimicrobiia bacterium]MDH5291542.1 NIPSNAP family protein [Acidimicrobiia bacterium]
MIYEIRNYHYEPSLMAEYKAWARDHALPHIRAELDLVGFWVNSDEPPQVTGAPLDDLGSATVTWIIRWPDFDTRNNVMDKVFATEAWAEISKHNPGLQHYHRIEVKFAEEL